MKNQNLVGQVAYHPNSGKTGTVIKLHEGFYSSSEPHVTVVFDDASKERFTLNELQVRKMSNY